MGEINFMFQSKGEYVGSKFNLEKPTAAELAVAIATLDIFREKLFIEFKKLGKEFELKKE